MGDFLFNSTDLFGDNNYYDNTTNEYKGSITSYHDGYNTISDANHQTIGTQIDNIFGGSDIQMSSGQQVQTMPNFIGGENLFINSQQAGFTESNIFGGKNTYDANGKLTATTYANIFGGESKF